MGLDWWWSDNDRDPTCKWALVWWMDSRDGDGQGLLRSVAKNVVSLQKDCPRECSCESRLSGQCVRISEYEARLVLGRQTKDNRAWL